MFQVAYYKMIAPSKSINVVIVANLKSQKNYVGIFEYILASMLKGFLGM